MWRSPCPELSECRESSSDIHLRRASREMRRTDDKICFQSKALRQGNASRGDTLIKDFVCQTANLDTLGRTPEYLGGALIPKPPKFGGAPDVCMIQNPENWCRKPGMYGPFYPRIWLDLEEVWSQKPPNLGTLGAAEVKYGGAP
jgi:hypothetical protein